jgi:hypothetical protein
VEGDKLCVLLGRLFDLSLDKDVNVAAMLVEEEGVKKINWRWMISLFE